MHGGLVDSITGSHGAISKHTSIYSALKGFMNQDLKTFYDVAKRGRAQVQNRLELGKHQSYLVTPGEVKDG